MITPVFILAAVLSLLFAVSTFSAPASLPEQAAEKAKSVTVEKFKLTAEKDGKKDARKFPLMFDIAERAQKKSKADKEKDLKAAAEKHGAKPGSGDGK